jgi:selenocysteine-specific elongation factor
MEQEGAINVTPRVVHLSGFEIELTPEQRDIRSYILDLLEGEGYSPPGINELLKRSPYGEYKTAEVLGMLVETGEVKRIGEDTVFLKDYYDGAVNAVVEHIKIEGNISLAALRDHLGTSRKYAMALLEEMDRDRVTKRVGDNRVLYR